MKKCLLLGLCLTSLWGCGQNPIRPSDADHEVFASAWARQSGLATPAGESRLASLQGAWVHQRLPGKQATQFRSFVIDGHEAMEANADSSASILRRKMQVPAGQAMRIRFSWKLPQLIDQGDMGDRDLDDTPVRVVLAFDGDRSTFSARNAMMNELSRSLTGEEMPYAVLMYVWSKKKPLGTVIPSPRTDRIRKLVVETSAQRLQQWLSYERDVVADFRHAYGEEPGMLTAIGIMTDTDNTRSKAIAWYGPVQILLD